MIYIIARNKHKIKELQRSFPKVVAYQADFSNLVALQDIVNDINNEIHSLDLLINNAAVQYTPMVTDNDFAVKSIVDEITTNFTSICYFLLPFLNQQHSAKLKYSSVGITMFRYTVLPHSRATGVSCHWRCY
jgi:uncharacterized oxidoreductase